MKRLWLAAAILVTTIGLCVVTQGYQQKQIDILLTELNELERVVKDQGAAAAVSTAESFFKEYERRTQLFPCFMSHNDLAGCHETAAILASTLEADHTEEFYQEASRCRTQLRRLRDVETLDLQNVL